MGTFARVVIATVLAGPQVGCGSDGAGEADAAASPPDAAVVIDGAVPDATPAFQPTEAAALDLGNPDKADDDPFVMRAQDGAFYLVFLSDRAADDNNDLYITRSDNGIEWIDPIRVTQHPDSDWYPTLFQSPDGMFHLIWFRAQRAAPFAQHLFYSHSVDGLTWDTADEVAVTSGLVDDWAPAALLDSSGELRIYFASQARGASGSRDLYLVRSTDGGGSWQPAELLEEVSSSDHEMFPWVVERGPDDYAMVFERYDMSGGSNFFDPSSDIFLSTSTDGSTWTAPLPVTVDAADDQVDALPSLFWAPVAEQWILGWTSTAHSIPPRGDLLELALDDRGDYPAAALNRSAVHGVPGWSARVADTPNPDVILMVWVSNATSVHPKLYGQLLER